MIDLTVSHARAPAQQEAGSCHQEAGVKRHVLHMPSPPRPKREDTRRSPNLRSLLRNFHMPGSPPSALAVNITRVDMSAVPACSHALPSRADRSLSFGAIDIPEGTGHHVCSPAPPPNMSTMFGLADACAPSEEVSLESLPALPTAALRHRFEYLMGVAKDRSEAAAGEPGLLRRVVRDFLQATHWAAPKSTLSGESSAWDKYWVHTRKHLV